MSKDYDQATHLANSGWVITEISSDGNGEYRVKLANEGDVNHDPKFPDDTADLKVSQKEAQQLSKEYGIGIVKI